MNRQTIFYLIVMLCSFDLHAFTNPEAFEVGPQNRDQLPGGKEADGIQGDFILRNDRIVAVIGSGAPSRCPNMFAFWGIPTPGCLYDLTLQEKNNDQLTIFCPSNQQGPISYVRIVKDGSDGEAVIETVVTAVNNDNLYKRHEYKLKEDWQGVLITTMLKNFGKETLRLPTADYWKDVTHVKQIREITIGEAMNPADKVGYAFAWLEQEGTVIPPDTVELASGESITYARFLAIGRSPAQAFGIVASLREPTGQVTGFVKDTDGNSVTTGIVEATIDKEKLNAYPNSDGFVTFRMPEGTYDLVVSDIGRKPVSETAVVHVLDEFVLDVIMESPARIEFDIQGDAGKSLPCKVQFLGIKNTPSPNLGPANRAHGCLDQYHSETGRFTVQIPPGDYGIIVTHGIEYSHLEREVKLKPGEKYLFSGFLHRVVDTKGWISADFHNHTTVSGDNTTGIEDRIINLAAEQIEFAPSTEHNRIFSWKPVIAKLDLEDELQTITGIELTGNVAHFNAFPLNPTSYLQGGGAPEWQKDPRIDAILLREFQGLNPETWVQINHPDMVKMFIDRDGDGREDGGYSGLECYLDGAETWGRNTQDGNILTKIPYSITKDNKGLEKVIAQRQFVWLQMLNRGHRYTSVAVSDAHAVHGSGVGGWRMYIPSSSDNPPEIDYKEIIRNAKAGRVVITNGPFLEVKTDDGILPGGSARAQGSINLHIKVQCTDWIDIDRIQILVNGRQREDLNFTREFYPNWFHDGVVKFDRTINVPLFEDSHLIVVAYGEKMDLAIGYGTSWQSEMHPCAYINPIYVDMDGTGFTPNGDTLGFPLPAKYPKVEEVKEMRKK